MCVIAPLDLARFRPVRFSGCRRRRRRCRAMREQPTAARLPRQEFRLLRQPAIRAAARRAHRVRARADGRRRLASTAAYRRHREPRRRRPHRHSARGLGRQFRSGRRRLRQIVRRGMGTGRIRRDHRLPHREASFDPRVIAALRRRGRNLSRRRRPGELHPLLEGHAGAGCAQRARAPSSADRRQQRRPRHPRPLQLHRARRRQHGIEGRAGRSVSTPA